MTRAHRDLTARLANAESTRERLLRVLARAQTVEDVLRVEAELERVTLRIERLRAELATLDSHIAMSTIRVRMQRARRPDAVGRARVRLPVPWLGRLGVGRLLDLNPTDAVERWREGR